MRTIGSHPGAINFRLALIIIPMLIFILVFLHYAGKAEKAIERQSIEQTQRIIDAALVVVFATHAAQGRLHELQALDGANPFEFLREYQVLPLSYRGEVEQGAGSDLSSGWHYLASSGELLYQPFHLSEPRHFRVSLNYDDVNQNGQFESHLDRFETLKLVERKPR